MPFDLHPEYPPEGIPRADLEARYGPDLGRHVRRMAAEAGLPYAPNPEVVPNSRRALELAEWARGLGGDAHERLHEGLMDAYWAQGRDIGRWQELEAVAAAAGLDATEGRAAVESGAFARPVDASTTHAQAAGITAVPAFVFDGRLLVIGAVPHEVLEQALERLSA